MAKVVPSEDVRVVSADEGPPPPPRAQKTRYFEVYKELREEKPAGAVYHRHVPPQVLKKWRAGELGLQDDLIDSLRYSTRLKFYWTGLRNNGFHKRCYMDFRRRLGELDKRMENSREIIRTGDHDEIPAHVILKQTDEVAEIMGKMEQLVVIYQVLFLCSNSPVDSFLLSHVERRKNFSGDVLKDDIKWQWQAAVGALAEINVMSQYVADAVTANDQLPFKLFLLLINLLTFIGQYVWSRAQPVIFGEEEKGCACN